MIPVTTTSTADQTTPSPIDLTSIARADILRLAVRVRKQAADGEPLGEADIIDELIRIAKILN